MKNGMTELEQALEDLGASHVLLDYFPAGPILHIDRGKALMCGERLVLAQLVED